MTGQNNTIGGNKNGVSFPIGNEEAIPYEENVQELKGRTDRFDVGTTEVESPVGTGSDSETSMQNAVGKTLQERKNALMKNGEEVKLPALGNTSNLRAKTKPASDAEVSVDEPSTVAVDAKQVSLFGSVLEQLTKEKGVTYNTVAKDVARAAEDGPEAPTKSEIDAIDDTYASIDELTAETTKANEPVIHKIKHYSRLRMFFRVVKRTLRTLVINTVDGVKAKDFRQVKPETMAFLKGTQLEKLATRYNELYKQLEDTDKSSLLRNDCKDQLLEQARLMDKEVDKLISCSDYLLHEACGEVSATDRAMLAEKLRNRIGFNFSLPRAMKAAESAEPVEDSVMSDADLPFAGLALSQSMLPESVEYNVPPTPVPVSGAGQSPADKGISSPEGETGDYDVPRSNLPVSGAVVGDDLPPPKPPRLPDINASVDGSESELSEADRALAVSDQIPASQDDVKNDQSFSSAGGDMPQASGDDWRNNLTYGPSDDFPPPPPPELMADPDELTQESPAANASATQSRSRGEKPEVPPKPADYPGKGKSKKE